MEKINAHICPACAGRLNIDEDRKLYLCPFCGVTFDYDYFREDDVPTSWLHQGKVFP